MLNGQLAAPESSGETGSSGRANKMEDEQSKKQVPNNEAKKQQQQQQTMGDANNNNSMPDMHGRNLDVKLQLGPIGQPEKEVMRMMQFPEDQASSKLEQQEDGSYSFEDEIMFQRFNHFQIIWSELSYKIQPKWYKRIGLVNSLISAAPQWLQFGQQPPRVDQDGAQSESKRLSSSSSSSSQHSNVCSILADSMVISENPRFSLPNRPFEDQQKSGSVNLDLPMQQLVTNMASDGNCTSSLSMGAEQPKLDATSNSQETEIFSHLDGSIKSGQLTAILGPSGAGKTSLLNCLTGKLRNGVAGHINLVGALGKQLKICTIPQKDHLLDLLTVNENLMFASKIKNPESNFDHAKNIERVINLLGLKRCRHAKIKKISGGQYKRVSIAQELLSNPDILVLDEPTSGLDSLTCFKTISMLRDLTELSANNEFMKPMAIIVTIHQPQPKVFNLFHHVYILANGGRVIYEGAPADSLATITRVTGIRPQASELDSSAIITTPTNNDNINDHKTTTTDTLNKDQPTAPSRSSQATTQTQLSACVSKLSANTTTTTTTTTASCGGGLATSVSSGVPATKTGSANKISEPTAPTATAPLNVDPASFLIEIASEEYGIEPILQLHAYQRKRFYRTYNAYELQLENVRKARAELLPLKQRAHFNKGFQEECERDLRRSQQQEDQEEQKLTSSGIAKDAACWARPVGAGLEHEMDISEASRRKRAAFKKRRELDNIRFAARHEQAERESQQAAGSSQQQQQQQQLQSVDSNVKNTQSNYISNDNNIRNDNNPTGNVITTTTTSTSSSSELEATCCCGRAAYLASQAASVARSGNGGATSSGHVGQVEGSSYEFDARYYPRAGTRSELYQTAQASPSNVALAGDARDLTNSSSGSSCSSNTSCSTGTGTCTTTSCSGPSQSSSCCQTDTSTSLSCSQLTSQQHQHLISSSCSSGSSCSLAGEPQQATTTTTTDLQVVVSQDNERVVEEEGDNTKNQPGDPNIVSNQAEESTYITVTNNERQQQQQQQTSNNSGLVPVNSAGNDSINHGFVGPASDYYYNLKQDGGARDNNQSLPPAALSGHAPGHHQLGPGADAHEHHHPTCPLYSLNGPPNTTTTTSNTNTTNNTNITNNTYKNSEQQFDLDVSGKKDGDKKRGPIRGLDGRIIKDRKGDALLLVNLKRSSSDELCSNSISSSSSSSSTTLAGNTTTTTRSSSSCSLSGSGSTSLSRGQAGYLYMSEQLQHTRDSDHKGRFWSHTITLAKRTFLTTRRDPLLMTSRVLFHLMIPVLMAHVYGQATGKANACPHYEPEIDITQIPSLVESKRVESMLEELHMSIENVSMFFIIMYAFSAAVLALNALSFPLYMQVLLKETRNGWYGMSSYVVAKTLADLPLELTMPSITMALVYPMTGQPDSYMQWRKFTICLIMTLCSLIAQTQALIIGALVMNSVQTAVFVSQASQLPWVILAGFTIRIKRLSEPLKLISLTSFYRLGCEAITLARYGFGICPCDPKQITGQPVKLVGIPEQVKVMAQYWLESRPKGANNNYNNNEEDNGEFNENGGAKMDLTSSPNQSSANDTSMSLGSQYGTPNMALPSLPTDDDELSDFRSSLSIESDLTTSSSTTTTTLSSLSASSTTTTTQQPPLSYDAIATTSSSISGSSSSSSISNIIGSSNDNNLISSNTSNQSSSSESLTGRIADLISSTFNPLSSAFSSALTGSGHSTTTTSSSNGSINLLSETNQFNGSMGGNFTSNALAHDLVASSSSAHSSINHHLVDTSMVGSANDQLTTTGQEVARAGDIFQNLANQLSYANSYGVNITSCDDVTPDRIRAINLTDNWLVARIWHLFLMLIIMKIILYYAVNFSIRIRL